MTTNPFRRAFTLIELLVVISIIALLVALLLPALSHAREAAYNVSCMANQKQIALGVLTYAEDHDGKLPPAWANNWYWPYHLLPWVGGESDIYECKSKLTPYETFNTYMANGGYRHGFDQQWAPAQAQGPTDLHRVNRPGKYVLIVETTEDWAIFQSGSATWWGQGREPFMLGGLTEHMSYFASTNLGAYGWGGRHFRGGGGRGTDPWGFSNINFGDGHVGSYSMQQIVEQFVTGFWFEYPHTPASSQAVNHPPPGPQPGSLWWLEPGWS